MGSLVTFRLNASRLMGCLPAKVTFYKTTGIYVFCIILLYLYIFIYVSPDTYIYKPVLCASCAVPWLGTHYVSVLYPRYSGRGRPTLCLTTIIPARGAGVKYISEFMYIYIVGEIFPLKNYYGSKIFISPGSK